MIAFFYMVFAERYDYFPLMDNNRNKGTFLCVQVFQRNADIGIALTCNKLYCLRLSVNQPVQAFDMCAVAVFTCS